MFLFVKQKTEYELRISYWSSDVCSSDLIYGPVAPVDTTGTLALAAANADFSIAEAGVRLARANRVPDLNVGSAIRRLEATNDKIGRASWRASVWQYV